MCLYIYILYVYITYIYIYIYIHIVCIYNIHISFILIYIIYIYILYVYIIYIYRLYLYLYNIYIFDIYIMYVNSYFLKYIHSYMYIYIYIFENTHTHIYIYSFFWHIATDNCVRLIFFISLGHGWSAPGCGNMDPANPSRRETWWIMLVTIYIWLCYAFTLWMQIYTYIVCIQYACI